MWFFFWNILYVVPAARFKRIKKKTGFSFAYLADLGGGGVGLGLERACVKRGLCVGVCMGLRGGFLCFFFGVFFFFWGKGKGGGG